ncbi:MAG: hypothetical protein A3D16_12290 [Rhodobacterales bacterium RIFCSPHIGHO2_02_FULL_62_130]|nr:MAG: hypothetical protein A3D16_12290 [Rhodobacterales bacterium RIFCSPHIGHO2_02_FULL_62_130]OHC53879.1 MAG: hypothetical protein A3E48_23310 [Rhodobacterales bacterium RIFCSPHIGHO2_12_FULL_62_75]HCZ00147.1 hypothetical protein [Rhodobacter sp.]
MSPHDHNAFFEMHRRREELRRRSMILLALNAAAVIVALLVIGALIGMALTTAEAMPAFLAEAATRARG